MPCMTYETPAEIAAREMEERAEREHAVTGPLIAKIDIQGRQIAHLEAMLCGVLSSISFLEGYSSSTTAPIYTLVSENFDEAEAGVTWDQLEEWWGEHKAADERRKRAEAAAREQKRQAALAKLTPAERELLGIG